MGKPVMVTDTPRVPSERVDSDWTGGVHMALGQPLPAEPSEMVMGSLAMSPFNDLRWLPMRDSAQSHCSHQLSKED